MAFKPVDQLNFEETMNTVLAKEFEFELEEELPEDNTEDVPVNFDIGIGEVIDEIMAIPSPSSPAS